MHEVRFAGEDILARQLELAEANYRRLHEKRIRSISVMGAIGSGKTTLIECAVDRLRRVGLRVGTIAADSAGDDDHRRFLERGAVSVNVNTQDDCHLDAHTVHHALDQLPLETIDVLFIENVGNLICPADFPLGTDVEIVVISVTEGDDMVRKHPKIFAQTDFVAVNKVDLAAAVGVDPRRIVDDYAHVNPHGKIVLASLRSGEGIDALLDLLGLRCTSTQW
ncbi:MAG: hydrogenase nickel incorporation protein HypB [Candidatus Bipolaricaulia bacterium]